MAGRPKKENLTLGEVVHSGIYYIHELYKIRVEGQPVFKGTGNWYSFMIFVNMDKLDKNYLKVKKIDNEKSHKYIIKGKNYIKLLEKYEEGYDPRGV